MHQQQFTQGKKVGRFSITGDETWQDTAWHGRSSSKKEQTELLKVYNTKSEKRIIEI